MFNSQVTLTLFFLYVVIVSDKFFDIISCRLQKLILSNLFVRHFFIFMNIFLFTFILGWYTEFSIFNAKTSFSEEFKNDKIDESTFTINNELKILLNYIFYSACIYLIFLLTTKCELEYLIVFLILIFVSFVIFLLKTYGKNNDEIKTKMSFFEYISHKEKETNIKNYLEKNKNDTDQQKRKRINKIYTNYVLTNTENTLFVISLIVLLFGFLIYFKRKYIEYDKNFKIIKFIFGSLKCKSIK